ncbi:MAG: hypothetical protein QME47_07125 [Candidatus Thermoplasmatota archaeon]|nr:hypothetical protein [Candidatus Thermoplasmatota archaeon]
MSEEGKEGKVKSWGLRLHVPAAILHKIGVSVGDEVEWKIEKRGSEKVAVLKKKEIKF